MTWEEAIKKIIQQYYADDPNKPQMQMDKLGESKYNKKYFDQFSKEQGFNNIDDQGKTAPWKDDQPQPKPMTKKPSKPSNTNKDAIPAKPSFGKSK